MQNNFPPMNPMQAAALSAVQNAFHQYFQPEHMHQQYPQQFQQPYGHYHEPSHHGFSSMSADEFARHMEHYCHEMAEGHRAMPHAVKEFFGTAWHGAKDAVLERFSHEDGEHEHKRHGGQKSGEKFWSTKMESLRMRRKDSKALTEELTRLFPNATPLEHNILRHLANEPAMSERAASVGLAVEEYRETLNRLMTDEH